MSANLLSTVIATHLKEDLYLYEFDANASDFRKNDALLPKDAARVIRDKSISFFRLPLKSKKGFYKHYVTINAMLINCCKLGVFEKYQCYVSNKVYKVEEKSEYRILEGDEWLNIYGWSKKGFHCRHGGAVFILPFHCVAVDWTGYEHLRNEFIEEVSNQEFELAIAC